MSRSTMLPPMRPRPTIASCMCSVPMKESKVNPGAGGAGSVKQPVRRKCCAKLVRGLKMDRLHSQRGRGPEILPPVVDEQCSRWRRLRHAKHAHVDLVRRLAHAEPAGAEEGRKDVAQPERADPMHVELRALVVERGQPNGL